MNRDEIKTSVLNKLARIAPELDPSQIDHDADLRRQIDLDSMDYLNLMIALSKQFKIDIPETDYPKLATLNGCVDYLSSIIL